MKLKILTCLTPYYIRVLIISLFLVSCGCAPAHIPVPPGTVPTEAYVTQRDEQYGHQVLAELTRQYQLSREDTQINRVRDIVDRLASAAGAANNPWHVYVLESPDFKNAAATRGNYIFVWTALLNSLKNDGELTTVLSHEIAHTLAGHTAPDPNEEVARILAQVASDTTNNVLIYRGVPSVVGDLAGILVRLGVEALVVNPDQKTKELEADHIGMFLMAKAGIDPEEAVKFWERAKLDPDFAGFPIEFLSSHPDAKLRYEKLLELLPKAQDYYKETLPMQEKIIKPIPHNRSKKSNNYDPSNGFAVR